MSTFRTRLYQVIFGTESPAGRTFDLVLLLAIVLSVSAVMADSVQSIHARYGRLLMGVEWGFTILFTVEYLARLICVRRPLSYATSFFGIIDLVSIVPTYLSLFMPGAQALLAIRIFRVLRVFRVLKLMYYLSEGQLIMQALKASRRKIFVFVFAILSIVVCLGSLMYLIEGPKHGFTSIPRGVYWAVVTLTTVGYGDITPQTPAGQVLAGLVMVLGYGMIAVPTGIVTAEMTVATRQARRVKSCPHCDDDDHMPSAEFCKSCGEKLIELERPMPRMFRALDPPEERSR